MNKSLKNATPYFLLLIGLFFLIIINIPILAGLFCMLGIFIILEEKWPEKWGDDINN